MSVSEYARNVRVSALIRRLISLACQTDTPPASPTPPLPPKKKEMNMRRPRRMLSLQLYFFTWRQQYWWNALREVQIACRQKMRENGHSSSRIHKSLKVGLKGG
jgi:hypothetical protein